MRALRLFTCALALFMLLPAAAHAYRLMPTPRPYPGPVVTVYNATSYGTQVTRIRQYLNQQQIGITLKAAPRAQGADIVIRYGSRSLRCSGGTAGFGGPGGVSMARNCRGNEAIMVLAHEMGHSLGLDHEDRRCAVMNSSYVIHLPGGSITTTRCSARSWFTTPYLRDDIAGLRQRFVNTAPVAVLTNRSGEVLAGESIFFDDLSRDAQRNIRYRSLDWGDGTAPATVNKEIYNWANWSGMHTYVLPGTYTAKLTVRDAYGKTSQATLSVVVGGDPPVDLCLNLDGMQAQIPAGLIQLGDMTCVLI